MTFFPESASKQAQFDLLVHNARVHTLDAASPIAEAILIHGGRVLAVGSDADFETVVVRRRWNAAHATVLPGFNDAHAHSIWFGLTLMEADLSQARRLEEVYDVVAAAARLVADGEWVIGGGLSPISLGGQPDPDELDRASNGKPVWLKHASGHAYTLSRSGLRLVDVEEHARVPIEGGQIGVDSDGRATGLFDEKAMSIVQAVTMPYPLATIRAALGKATDVYASEGLTSVTDAGTVGGWIAHSPGELAAYQDARDHGELSTRIQTMVTIDALRPLGLGASDLPTLGLSGGLRSGFGDEFLSLGPTKVFSDGSLLGRTAAMTEPYVGCPHNHGYFQADPAQLRADVLSAYRGGWAVALHAIGDRAVDLAIETIVEAQRKYGWNSLPNRVEHGGVVRPDQIALLATHGIALVPQHGFIRDYGAGMREYLGDARTSSSYPGKSLLTAGALLAGSSDRPVAGGNPLQNIQSAVERLAADGFVYGPDERLSVDEAVAAYSAGSAAATGFSTIKGRISPGYLADLVLLDAHPRDVPVEAIGGLDVLGTIMHGRQTYG